MIDRKKDRAKRQLAILRPIYDRARRACQVDGQRHLRDFEEAA